MGLSFKKPASGGGGGGSGSKPKMGGHRAKTAPKPPDTQDLLGNSALAKQVSKPVEEESHLLAPPSPKQVVAPPTPVVQPAVKGAKPVLPTVPSREGRPPLSSDIAPKQAVVPSAPIEQPAVTIAPPLPSTQGRPPLSSDMAPKQAVVPPAPIEQPAVTGAERVARPRGPLVRQDAKADLGVKKPTAPTEPVVAPQAEEPAKKKKKGFFSGLGKKKEPKAAKVGPTREERDAAVHQALIDSGLMAGPEKKKAPLEKVTDRDIKKKKALGGGSAHAVTAVDTKTEIGNSGQKKGFFKANPEQEDAASAVTAGIGQEKGNSHMAARAVTSARVDQMLGTNVLTDDKFAKVKGEQGVVSPMAQGTQLAKKSWAEISPTMYREAYEPMGPDMAKQDGKKFYKYDGMSAADVDLARPETQKGMSDLGVNDYLSGQVDRHTGNMFIDPKTGKVTGIDNDMAFGTEDYSKKSGKNGMKGLPSLIDEKTAERILTMDRDEYEATLRGKAEDQETLTEEEVEQAMDRYGDMKAHCAQLKKDGKLVKVWNAETFEASEKEAEEITDFDAGSNLMARAINTQRGASAKH